MERLSSSSTLEAAQSSPRVALGAMTGTSLDALDLALVEIKDRGLCSHASLLHHQTFDLGPLRPRLRAASLGKSFSAGDFLRLALDFGNFHAACATELLKNYNRSAGTTVSVKVAGLHGQTIFHAPPLSWQIINPYPVARALGCPVASDLRGADLAAGGQGAPITPLADWILFRGHRPRTIVNLGGFCNITWLPSSVDDPAKISGCDVCPCNHILDHAAKLALDIDFDPEGSNAAKGSVHPAAESALTQSLKKLTAQNRSLGSGDEGFEWVNQWASQLTSCDLLATAVNALARAIATSITSSATPSQEVLLAGGGALNATLAQKIAEFVNQPVYNTQVAAAIHVSARESVAMAVLAALAWDGYPTTLSSVTHRGASNCRDGLWCLPRDETQS
ncbi:MAG: anhydro-N-acetylmuramic acid kinase [Planctomycetes bacterium]|nr:anhydro-N-acetylmuramic acid kinase [Planctomycetota bacterium]